MRLFIYLFSLLFMVICCDPPLTPEELAELADANDPRARITMDMTEELELTISIKNFEDKIAIITFNLIYDNTVLKVISYSGGELGAPLFANIDEMDVDNDSTQCSFAFSGDYQIDGIKTLLKVNFSQKSNYEGTTVFIGDILMADANGNEVIFDHSENYWSESACYLSEHPTNGEILFGGDYRWANGYCWPLNYVYP